MHNGIHGNPSLSFRSESGISAHGPSDGFHTFYISVGTISALLSDLSLKDTRGKLKQRNNYEITRLFKMKKCIAWNETTKLIGILSKFGPRGKDKLYQQLSHMLQNTMNQLTLRIKQLL